MKPVNTRELRNAYLGFVAHFCWLLILIILCTVSYFATSRREMELLSKRAREYDQIKYNREEISGRFDNVLWRLRALTQYVKADPEEYSNQAVLMNAVQAGDQGIRGMLDDEADSLDDPARSLYRRMSGHVVLLSTLEDSLSQTRFQIESLREQLNACSTANQAAARTLSGIN
jgi:hypothetical protein